MTARAVRRRLPPSRPRDLPCRNPTLTRTPATRQQHGAKRKPEQKDLFSRSNGSGSSLVGRVAHTFSRSSPSSKRQEAKSTDHIDEAQNIKNDSTKAAKAATALEAKYRWCLTGTPIQNNVLELYSLFRFLRVRPLDDWDLFRDRIVKPMNRGQVGLAMKRLHVLLKVVMLRRTKDATIGRSPAALPNALLRLLGELLTKTGLD